MAIPSLVPCEKQSLYRALVVCSVREEVVDIRTPSQEVRELACPQATTVFIK